MQDSSLWQIYQKILYRPNKWMYYHDAEISTDLKDIMQNNQRAFDWITSYFARGEKSCLMDALKPTDHTIHSISTFFLGIQLQHLFGVEKCYKSKWLYYWFLVCLYHDAGYYVENDKVQYPLDTTLNQLCLKLGVTLSQKNQFLDKLPISGSDSVRIDRQLVERYYDYCRSQLGEHSFLNHGIVSAMLLYDRLVTKLHEILGDLDHRIYRNRVFDRKDEKKFVLIAESIIHHHIWAETDKQKYKAYINAGLGTLCIDQNQRLWYSNPLTNLLLFCDSIEPVKNAKLQEAMSPKEILENIYVTYSNKERTITLHVNKNNPSLMEWISYIGNTVNLDSWFCIDSEKTKDYAIKYQLVKDYSL